MSNARLWSLFWLLTVAIAFAVAWFLGNLLYTVLWTVLGDRGFPVTEAKVTAYIAAHLLPFLAILLVGAILSLLIRRQIAAAAGPQIDISPSRASPSRRFIGAMEAIYWIAEKSAWGRWMEAQYRTSGKSFAEIFKLTTAEQLFRRAAENGEIIIKGRLAKSIEYGDFDQHFWHNTYFDIQSNPASIWQASIKARMATGIEIPEYDDAIVERARIEALWRRRDWRYDWPTFQLNLHSAWKRMTDKKPNVEESHQSTQPEAPTPAPVPSAAPVTHHVVAAAALGTETKLVANPKVQISVTPYAPENWERLFAVGDDGKSVWLHFLPDTKHYRADTLVLVVYGQKVLLSVLRVRVGPAHAAVDKTVDNAPNRPRTSNAFLASILVMQQLTAAANLDWVDQCVPRYLERVGLSQGGFYQLTQDGESYAAGLAYDLIRRA